MISLSSSPCFFFLLSLLFPSLLEESAERERERERESERERVPRAERTCRRTMPGIQAEGWAEN